MRARLLGYWPELSHHFNLQPWHVSGPPVLTYSEAEVYVEAVDAIRDAAKKQGG